MARILLAEDDSELCRVLAHALREAGHEVGTATDGRSTCEELVATTPEVLILGSELPGMESYEILREIESSGLRESTKVLVLMAKASEHNVEVSFELGADHFVNPFAADEVVTAVAELLTLSRDELKERREEERGRAHLLSELESIFGD